MFCCDTGSFPAIDISKMTRVEMSVEDAKEIAQAVHTVRSFGHGSGEVCIPFVYGIFDAIRVTLTKHRGQRTKKPKA